MEVFLHNVPQNLTSQALDACLMPFMRELQIVDFFCSKSLKKAIGHITFLSKDDAQRFLDVHGQEEIPSLYRPRPKLKSHLLLLGTGVFCKASNREPMLFALRALEYQKQQREQSGEKEDTGRPHIKMEMHKFSCGYCTFVGKDVAYTAEVVWHQQGSIEIKGRNFLVTVNNEYLIRIPLVTVVGLVYDDNGLITLTLSDVPFFFHILPKSSVDSLLSQLNLETPPPNEITHSRLPALGSDHAAVVGGCLVYQFHCMDIASLDRMQSVFEIDVIAHELLRVPSPVTAPASFPDDLQTFVIYLGQWLRLGSLSFGVLYQLQALVYNAYLHPKTVLDLGHRLCSIARDRRKNGARPLSAHAVRRLFDLIDWPLPFGDPQYFQVDALVSAIDGNEDLDHHGSIGRTNADSQANQCLIHRVQISPTRMMLHGPEIEPQNRILRKFPRYHDRFIRVQFCDENGGELFSPLHQDYSIIFERFEDIMKQGIFIAGRNFSFLGFSHSSLRSHAVWFASPFVDADGHFQTPVTIIKALGDFSTITSPARCAARIGQAFSETPYTLHLPDGAVQHIPDITSPDGSRVFSDGIGTVSRSILHSVWAGIPPRKGTPTCLQVRLGAAKGMVALDPSLTGSVVRLRPSMVKFPTDDVHDMGICNMASRPYPLYLNRQLIKILEDMGVPDHWFFQLQSARLNHLQVVTAHGDKTATFLKETKVADPIQLHRLFRQCHWSDLNYQEEPFLRSIVQAVVLRELRLLKHKARIPVRQGMTLYGIIDETGLLHENEIYVTFDTCGGRFSPPPGPGPVLVARSPALHDGDIQVAYNVCPPIGHALTKHKNCIIFSQKGQRDLPSQLSGGDLDGDVYHVIWDSIAQNVQTSPPADYPRVKPLDIGRPVTVTDMAQFFVEFMNTDRLGMIATRHMILADRQETGTHHEDCRKLAELHSAAVDYSKTGIAVDMIDIPKTGRFRPDFMAPGPLSQVYTSSKVMLVELASHAAFQDDSDQPSVWYYQSEKILGKLYRAINEKQIWDEHLQTDQSPDTENFWEHFLEGVLYQYDSLQSIIWKSYEGEARQIQHAYNDAISVAMHDFSDHPILPISELEVVIGIIISPSGVQTRRHRDRSRRLKDEFDRISTWITTEIRQGGRELCLACVHIPISSDRKSTRHHDKEDGILKSFRVVAACALLAEVDARERKMRKDV